MHAYLMSPLGLLKLLWLLVPIWIACVVVASIVGNRRGNLAAGFLLGLFLGPIGVRIAGGLIPPNVPPGPDKPPPR